MLLTIIVRSHSLKSFLIQNDQNVKNLYKYHSTVNVKLLTNKIDSNNTVTHKTNKQREKTSKQKIIHSE